jgi:hypothetical protein
LGGPGLESPTSSYHCANGDILVAFQANELFNPNAVGVDDIYGGGAFDAVIARFNLNGELLWWTFFGGLRDDAIGTLTEDSQGNIWAGGRTTGVVPVSSNAVSSLNPWVNGFPDTDGFIAKFSFEGVWLDGTLIGGDGVDMVTALQVRDNGIILIGGTTSSTGLGVGAVYDSELNTTGGTIFVASLAGIGEVLSFSYFEGNEAVRPSSIGYDPTLVFNQNGELFCNAYTESNENVLFGQSQFVSPFGLAPGLCVKLNSFGFPIWSSFFTGRSLFNGVSEIGDGLFSVYGIAEGDASFASINGSQQSITGFDDGFISVWNTDGEMLWARYLGSDDQTNSYRDRIEGVCRFQDKIAFCGTVENLSDVSTSNAWHPQPSAGGEVRLGIMGWYSMNGDLEYCSYFPQADFSQRPTDCLVDGSSLILLLETYGYSDWVPSPELNQEYVGLSDLLLVKFDINTLVIDKDFNSSIAIYPNPAHAEIVFTGVNVAGAQVEVYDTQGKLCLKRVLNGSLNISELESGLFISNIQTKDGRMYTSKFIKQ